LVHYSITSDTAIVGFLAGHFLAIGRDRRKEFNDAADALAKILSKEKVFPNPQGCIIDFSTFRRVLSNKELSRFDRCVVEFENAKKDTKTNINHNNGRDALMLYHNTSSIITAIEKLEEFTKRK